MSKLRTLQDIVKFEDPRDFTHEWATKTAIRLQNLAAFLTWERNAEWLRNLRMVLAEVFDSYFILESQKNRLDFPIFNSPSGEARVCLQEHCKSYHHAVGKITEHVVHTIWLYVFSKVAPSRITKGDLEKMAAADTGQITAAVCNAVGVDQLDDALNHFSWLEAEICKEYDTLIRGESDASGGVQTSAPFIPSPLQAAILAELDGQSLKKQALADAVAKGDGGALYRHGDLKELRDRGLVDHKRRVGFFRPDAPPGDE